MALIEEQRYLHEDLERLEQGIADRMHFEPTHIRDRLNRDHEVAQLLDQIQKQSTELLAIYNDATGQHSKEILQIGSGDPFEEFNRRLADIRQHHARYPNEQVENSELRYRPKPAESANQMPYIVESMFSGVEAYGRFFDLYSCHERFINLPSAKRISYLQYLDIFDNFALGGLGLKRADKLTDEYFAYLGDLAQYLESFMRRTRPLENLDKVFTAWDQEFECKWDTNHVAGWEIEGPGTTANGNAANRPLSTAQAIWCETCEKDFNNENVYKAHLTGRKHVKAAEEHAKRQQATGTASAHRLKERAIAEREYRINKLSAAMSTEREDTRVNVDRRQGLSERERLQELEALYGSSNDGMMPPRTGPGGEDDDDKNDDDKIYNPLKLPLAWDGKPIPFWLYRLHGLGQEFPCEICGNYVYMGRRAFDKHFNEANHIYGLKCLGITNTYLFRDITSIQQALQLWEKIQRDRKNEIDDGSIVQMEDAEGNVMPEKVYYDLQKQGLL